MLPEEDADPAWVGRLSGCPPASAERWIDEARADRRLFGHIAREHAREGRSSYVEIDAPLELHALVRALRPPHVVEVGVSSGVSSAYLLAALRRNGRGTLHSVDLPTFPKGRGGRRRSAPSWSLPPGRMPGWAVPPRLRDGWDLRIGDKRDVLPRLATELSGVGLFVYDVPHADADAHREFSSLDRAMPPGAVAVADHGPGGGLCLGLRRWAHRVGARPVRRAGLGLYGFRKPVGPPSDPASSTERTTRAPAVDGGVGSSGPGTG